MDQVHIKLIAENWIVRLNDRKQKKKYCAHLTRLAVKDPKASSCIWMSDTRFKPVKLLGMGSSWQH